jgi:hypothetical protein
MEKNLYKQAIVDAKAVRASAIANAKATLQESIEPKIQEMMRMKLAEDFGEDELEEEFDMQDEGFGGQEDDTIDEASLDEILDELNSLEEDDAEAELNEEADLEEDDDYLSEEDDEDGGEEGNESDDAPEAADKGGSEFLEVDADQLLNVYNMIKDLLPADALDGEGEGEDFDLGDMGDEDGGEGEALDLGSDEESMEETLSLDEVLAQLEAEELEEKKDRAAEKKADKDLEEKVDKMEEELEEAQDAIITLNETLKELNLLNAKLLFANKILRAKNLSESEKSRVIKAFDRTKTVKETKNTYATLMESLSTTKQKTQIKESIGFASKPAGVAPKSQNPIVESDGFINRWQQLAGIK